MTHLFCRRLRLGSKPFRITALPQERHRRLSLETAAWVPASVSVCHCPGVSKSRLGGVIQPHGLGKCIEAAAWKGVPQSDRLDFNWALPGAQWESREETDSFFK